MWYALIEWKFGHTSEVSSYALVWMENICQGKSDVLWYAFIWVKKYKLSQIEQEFLNTSEVFLGMRWYEWKIIYTSEVFWYGLVRMENYIHIPGFWYVLVYIRGALVCVGINGKLYTHPKCFCIRWYQWKIISLTKSEEFWYALVWAKKYKPKENGQKFLYMVCVRWYEWKIIFTSEVILYKLV